MSQTAEQKLAILEERAMANIQDHKEIKSAIEKNDCKLDKIVEKIDTFIEKKADKEEIKEVRTDINGLKNGAIFQLLGLLIALVLAGIALKK